MKLKEKAARWLRSLATQLDGHLTVEQFYDFKTLSENRIGERKLLAERLLFAMIDNHKYGAITDIDYRREQVQIAYHYSDLIMEEQYKYEQYAGKEYLEAKKQAQEEQELRNKKATIEGKITPMCGNCGNIYEDELGYYRCIFDGTRVNRDFSPCRMFAVAESSFSNTPDNGDERDKSPINAGDNESIKKDIDTDVRDKTAIEAGEKINL